MAVGSEMQIKQNLHSSKRIIQVAITFKSMWFSLKRLAVHETRDGVSWHDGLSLMTTVDIPGVACTYLYFVG